MNSKLSYCGELVRAHDPDRFMLSMFAPQNKREALWALFAFNHEVAKTRSVVSDTQLGLIRLQWWREEISKLYEGRSAPEHEILKPLAGAIQSHALNRELFETLIYAREFDLEDTLPGNIEGLLNYCDFTSTPLLSLCLNVLEGAHIEAQPIRPIAVNYALAGIIRSVPHLARERRCLLPEDLMQEHRQSVNKLYDLMPAEGLSAIIKTLSEQAVTGIRTDNRFLKATQNLNQIHFNHLSLCKYDVFSARALRDPALKALRLVLSIMYG